VPENFHDDWHKKIKFLFKVFIPTGLIEFRTYKFDQDSRYLTSDLC
jgi:hypothetical protein